KSSRRRKTRRSSARQATSCGSTPTRRSTLRRDRSSTARRRPAATPASVRREGRFPGQQGQLNLPLMSLLLRRNEHQRAVEVHRQHVEPDVKAFAAAEGPGGADRHEDITIALVLAACLGPDRVARTVVPAAL